MGFSIALFICSAGIFTMGFFHQRNVMRLKRTGVRVEAVISGFRNAGVEGPRKRYPIVSFSKDDGTEQKINISDGAAGTEIGQKVGLLYDPDNPGRAVIDTPFFTFWKAFWLFNVSLGFLLLGLLLLVVG